MFLGSILGGAIGGAISFALPGLGIAGSAFITGAISTGIGMGLENAIDGTTHSFLEIVGTSLFAGAFSALTAGLTSKIQISGLTGRGSISQVARQVGTKFYNGTIKHITMTTLWKIFAYESFYSLFSVLSDIISNTIKHYIQSPQLGKANN